MKTCRDCGETKPINLFYSAPQCEQGVRPECRQCNKAHRANRHRKAKIENPEQRKSVVLKHKYGITMTDYYAMLANQNGQCKICKSSDPGPKGRFAVDHCHKTEKVRGLLCYLCNIGLGSFRDNQEFLAGAIHYLKESQ